MSSRLPKLLLLVLALGLGSWLRLHDLELYRLSPDEGNYLYSAGVARLPQDTDLGAGVRSDLDWLLPRYYPHSYLHQLTMRWVWRSGASAVESVRLDSALLGLLTALATFAAAARMSKGVGWAAVTAGGIVALQCLHVWYARTGWGQTGCTTFFALYLWLGWELFRSEGSVRRDALLAAGMALAALFAYGWHEMIVVHVGGMGLWVLAEHVVGVAGCRTRGLRALPRTLVASRKAWAALLSALPIVALFAYLVFHPFAQKHWIDFDEADRPGIARIVEHLVTKEELHLQLGWPILLLAAIGLVALFRSDRFTARYLAWTAVTSSLVFLLFYKDAFLVRIYLPTAVVLAILSGFGVEALGRLAPQRARSLATGALALLVLAWAGAVSHRTIHDWERGDELLFQPRFHHLAGFPLVDARDVHAETFAVLRERLAPGEVVGVEAIETDGNHSAGEFSVLFRLRDAGFAAAPFLVDGPRRPRPRFLMGVRAGMTRRGNTVETGGPYREIGADRFGRIGLYELESSARRAPSEPGG